MKNKNLYSEAGQIIVIALIFMAVMLLLTGGLVAYVLQNTSIGRNALFAEQALGLADAGVDKAVWQLNATAGAYTGETNTNFSTGAMDITVANISGNVKEITVTAYAPNKTSPKARKQTKVQVQTNNQIISFNYGIQVGAGGLDMGNNSQVNGSVYSNGPITLSNGARITGVAYSSGASGLIDGQNQNWVDGGAYAHTIRDTTVGGVGAHGYSLSNTIVNGPAEFNTLSSCTINGTAKYTTKSSCSITGSQTTPYAGYPDPAPGNFPISSQQITDWKNQATSGGTITGNYTLTNQSQATLGPKKITGNLSISNNSQLTITGPIWVQGSITFSNQATIRLASSYGSSSEVMIADGNIDSTNNATYQGAGAGSYILMVTMSASGNAFSISNQTTPMIAYAPNGTIQMTNNSGAKELTAYRISMSNQSTITYDAGLANLNFSGGPGGSWQIVRGTWRLLD